MLYTLDIVDTNIERKAYGGGHGNSDGGESERESVT